MTLTPFNLIEAKKHFEQSSAEAVQHYADAWIKAEPHSFEALQFSGWIAARRQEMQTALYFFKRALKVKPDEISILTNLSNTYVALGKTEEALQHLYQALRLNPRHAESYNNLGRLFYKQGQIEKAIPLFKKALRLEPHYWEAHYNLAHSFASLHQMHSAATHYQEVLRTHPTHAMAHFNLGLIYIEKEEYLLARTHLQEATTLNPKHADSFKFLGEVLVVLGHGEAAIEAYEHGLQLAPQMASVHHNLAILYLKNERRAEALLQFKEAFALDATNESAAHMIRALSATSQSLEAPASHIKNLFDQYADYYNDDLKTKLRYQVPTLLRNAVGSLLPKNPKGLRILDLGCGTGLCGIVFRDLAKTLVGVDISSAMISQAKALEAYDALWTSDIQTYLEAPDLVPFDLVIAGDVLIYKGDLSPVFKQIASALSIEGRLAFTTEYLPEGDYALQPTGRFAHSSDYIHRLAHAHQLEIALEQKIIPRYNGDRPVEGQLFVLKLIPCVKDASCEER